ISVTLGVSLTIRGLELSQHFFTLSVISAIPTQVLPKAIPPALTLGHETFNSIASISLLERILAISQYSSIVFPAIFAMIAMLNCLKNGISSLMNFSTPGFCNPVSYTHLRAHETDSYLVC